MKKRVVGLYKSILESLPRRLHRPALFFYSEKKMLEYAGDRMGMKYKEIRRLFYDECASEQYNKGQILLPRKYQIKESQSILGLAFPDELLLNCYGLSRETDNVVKFVILHELGHCNDNKKRSTIAERERWADKFALRFL